MDETRIPKGVERIIRLDPENPTVLFRRKAKEKGKKYERFKKSVKDAAVAFADVQRRGTEAVLEKLPDSSKGDLFEEVGNRVIKLRKRGMKMLGINVKK